MTDVETIAQALHQATELAVSLHKKHFGEIADWTPLDDLAGVLLQIDNMTTGITRTEQWNTDMDAAPRDGTDILTICRGNCSVRYWGEVEDGEDAWQPRIRGLFPERWMHLPPEGE